MKALKISSWQAPHAADPANGEGAGTGACACGGADACAFAGAGAGACAGGFASWLKSDDPAMISHTGNSAWAALAPGPRDLARLPGIAPLGLVTEKPFHFDVAHAAGDALLRAVSRLVSTPVGVGPKRVHTSVNAARMSACATSAARVGAASIPTARVSKRFHDSHRISRSGN
jgi:hypothetical protein